MLLLEDNTLSLICWKIVDHQACHNRRDVLQIVKTELQQPRATLSRPSNHSTILRLRRKPQVGLLLKHQVMHHNLRMLVRRQLVSQVEENVKTVVRQFHLHQGHRQISSEVLVELKLRLQWWTGLDNNVTITVT
jgi:hypothetical protein